MSNENNAGVDLDKTFDKMEVIAQVIESERMPNTATALRNLIDLARRASATPRSKDAGGEPIYQVQVDGKNWCDIEEKDIWGWKAMAYPTRIVYAAPVRTEVD